MDLGYLYFIVTMFNIIYKIILEKVNRSQPLDGLDVDLSGQKFMCKHLYRDFKTRTSIK